MELRDATLTEAHHHLGDLLALLRVGIGVRLVNEKRERVVGYLLPPKEAQALGIERDKPEPLPALEEVGNGD